MLARRDAGISSITVPKSQGISSRQFEANRIKGKYQKAVKLISSGFKVKATYQCQSQLLVWQREKQNPLISLIAL